VIARISAVASNATAFLLPSRQEVLPRLSLIRLRRMTTRDQSVRYPSINTETRLERRAVIVRQRTSQGPTKTDCRIDQKLHDQTSAATQRIRLRASQTGIWCRLVDNRKAARYRFDNLSDHHLMSDTAETLPSRRVYRNTEWRGAREARVSTGVVSQAQICDARRVGSFLRP
jgi:hypothetical protein